MTVEDKLSQVINKRGVEDSEEVILFEETPLCVEFHYAVS